MTMTTLTMERAHHAAMDGDPTLPARPMRRMFSAAYKLETLAEYEAAPTEGNRGAILRREGLYSSHIVEWRRARDAGALAPAQTPDDIPRGGRAGPPAPTRRAGGGRAGEGAPGDRHPGKSIGALGTAAGRGRRGPEAAAVIDAAFTALEPIVGTRGGCIAVGRPRASHDRRGRRPRHGPPRPRPTPPNALSGEERQVVREVLRSERFEDRAPAQAWATLLDEGIWLASESTMYRILRSDGEVHERRRQASHPPRTIPELVANGPNEVWSYDTTALRGPRRGVWFRLFMMLDIFSRYCPAGWSSRTSGRTPCATGSRVSCEPMDRPSPAASSSMLTGVRR